MDCKYCKNKMERLILPTMDYLPEHVDDDHKCPVCGAIFYKISFPNGESEPIIDWKYPTKPSEIKCE